MVTPRQSHDFTNAHPNVNSTFRAEVERALKRLQSRIAELQAEVDAIDTSGGGGAPLGASYVTASAVGLLTNERVLTAGAGITVTDNGGNSTIVVTNTVSAVTQEQVEDWVAGLIDDTSSVTWTYNDAGGSLTASIVTEYLQDTVGAMLTTTSTVIPAYNDPAGTLSWAVDESGLVLWEQVRDINCAVQAANNWDAGGDGTYSLGGLTWNIVNTGVSDTFGPDGATGVRFNASAGTTTVFNNTSRTATYIWIDGGTLIPNFNPLGEYIVEFGYSSLTLGTTGDEVGCFWWNSSSNRTIRAGRRNTAGSQQTHALLDGNSNGTTGYTDTAFALRIEASTAAIASGAFAAGAFPAPYIHLGSQVSLNSTSPLQSPIFDTPNLRIGFAWPANTIGNADSTLARIRVWRRRGFA